MSSPQRSDEDRDTTRRTIEVGIRVGLVLLLAFWCLQIVRPFLHPLVWGAVIAVAAHPLQRRLQRALGGRPRAAATVLVVAALLLLIGPAIALTASLVETAGRLSGELRHGTLAVPPPPADVAGWPLVGGPLHAFWATASDNTDAALTQLAPQLKAIGLWLVSTGATTGIGIVKFVISLLIAGVLLAHGARVAEAVRGVATRVADDRGARLIALAGDTVQSVTRGILGVALIQSLLAGVGFLAVGVPAAGLCALLVLIVAVVQLPPLLVIAPVVVYVFATSGTFTAIAFAVWGVFVSLIDTPLKPLLMGRGGDVPVIVVFMGAIGGFMLDGLIGLFTGAVLLALGYSLFVAWLEQPAAAKTPPAH